jgi:uncharacterized protein (TIGR04255 family)
VVAPVKVHSYSDRAVPDRPQDLPNYTRPPVHEVLLAVQFDALADFRAYHVGKLWDRVRDRYSSIQEQAPLNLQFETFGVAEPAETPSTIQIEALLAPPMARYWFEAGQRLMQIQQDRLIHNWRRGESEAEYPRYESVVREFLADFRAFSDFVKEEEFGAIRINQCEISYINTIFVPGAEEDPYKVIDRVMRVWNRPDVRVGAFEQVTIQPRFVLSKDGEPYARLHVTLQPAVRRSTRQPCLQLGFTVRGKPTDETIDSSLAFFSEGREAIVKVFTDLTTPEMHKVWGRTDAIET